MSDLIERLREMHTDLEAALKLGSWSAIDGRYDELLRAANALEAKDKRIEQLEAALRNTECTCLSFHGGKCDRCKALGESDELSKVADTLQEAIDIAADYDPFEDLQKSGGLPESQALGERDE